MAIDEENEDKKIVLEKKKLASMGPDVVVIIPRKLIKYKIIDPDKLYDITFEEVEEHES